MNRFSQKILIGEKLISKKSPAFIIGEIGSNHDGSIKQAKELIDLAKEVGVDAVKFQSLKFGQLYLPGDKKLENLHKKIDLPESAFAELFDYTHKKGLIFLSSPTYFRSIDILEELGVKAYKVASPITVGFQSLILAMAKKNKAMIVSTGYCTLQEIDRAVKTVAESGNRKLVLLHCLASYPIFRAEDVNLGFMQILGKRYNCLVGFSDHTMSVSVPAVAVSMGAKVIEKHFTLSRKLDGPDHWFALEPKELFEMVKNIREAEKIIGDQKIILPSEKKMKKKIMMKLVAASDLSAGSVLKSENFIFRRAHGGIEEYKINRVLGKKIKKPIKKMELLTFSHIS